MRFRYQKIRRARGIKNFTLHPEIASLPIDPYHRIIGKVADKVGESQDWPKKRREEI